MIMQVLCINRSQDKARRNMILDLFDDVIFIDAVDKNTLKRPSDATCRDPGRVACYLSHIRAWEYLSNSVLREALIIQDDVMPSGDIESLSMKDCDVLMLHPSTCAADDQGNFLFGYGLWGHAITKEAARISVENTGPIRHSVDVQWFAEMFKHTTMFASGVKNKRLLVAKVLSEDIIKPNELAVNSVIGGKANMKYCGGSHGNKNT